MYNGGTCYKVVKEKKYSLFGNHYLLQMTEINKKLKQLCDKMILKQLCLKCSVKTVSTPLFVTRYLWGNIYRYADFQ